MKLYTMDQLRDALFGLYIQDIPESWTDAVVGGKFSVRHELPPEISDQFMNVEDCSNHMTELIIAVKNWLEEYNIDEMNASVDETRRHLWDYFNEWNVVPKSLVCFISTFLKYDVELTDISDMDTIFSALVAARLYMNVLCLPKAAVFNLYDETVFNLAMEVVKFATLATSSPKKSDKKGRKMDKTTANRRSTSPSTIGSDEKRKLLECICLFLDDVYECLTKIRLCEEGVNHDTPILILMNIIRLDSRFNVFITQPANFSVEHAIKSAFTVLEQFCAEIHGNIDETMRNVYKCIRSHILFVIENMKLTMKDNDMTRAMVFSFMKRLMDRYRHCAIKGTIGFIHQILLFLPDKTELRAKVCADLAFLTVSFPPLIVERIVGFATYLAHAELVKHRVTALEFVAKLITYTDNTQRRRFHELLVAVLLSRFLDISALVRYKSISTFASVVCTQQRELRRVMDDLFVRTDDVFDDTPFENTDLIITDDFIKKNERLAHEETFFERLPSKLLPTGSRVVKVLERFCYDGKVYVRKSAIVALYNIALLNSQWLSAGRLQVRF